MAKVIDFGVAKATQGQLTDKTLFTQFRQFVGTPAYISPEQTQSSAVDVDTRSDIYSLGILLYELLTGMTPLDSEELQKAGFNEMCRRVREEEPPTPSVRLTQLTHQAQSSIAEQRGTEPRNLTIALKRDLDWVVMKAIEKDRTRRYDSALALREDVECFLNNEPVSAAAPSAAYRFSKFARRNGTWLVVAATIGSLLMTGMATSTWLAFRANQARIRGEQLRYAADMGLVQAALQLSDAVRAKAILKSHIPKASEPDMRGWEWRFLYGQLDQSLASIQTHKSVHAIAMTSDGETLAVAGPSLNRTDSTEDGRVDVYEGDLDDFAERKMSGSVVLLKSHDFARTGHVYQYPSGARQLRFSPDGKHLDMSSRDARRFALDEPQENADEPWLPPVELWPVKVDPNRLFTIGIVADDSEKVARGKLACYSFAGRELVSESKVFQLPDPFWWSREVRLSPDGSRVTASHFGRELHVYSVPDLLMQELIIPTPGEVAVVGWSGDGQLIATGYNHPFQVDVWNATTGTHVHSFATPTSPGCSFAFSSDNLLLAFGELHDLIQVFDLARNERRQVFLGHEGEVNVLQFLADDETLISGGVDGFLKKWDASPDKKTELRQTSEETELWFVEYSPDGNLLAFSAADGKVRLFDAKTKKLVDTLEPAVVRDGKSTGWPRSQVRFSRDGRTLVADNGDDTITVYDLLSRERRLTLTYPELLFDMDLSPDGEMVAGAGIAKTMVVWDTKSGKELFRVDHEERNIDSVAFSPDMKSRLMAYETDSEVTLMHIDTRQETTVKLPNSIAWSLTFSHDGKLLFCGCQGHVEVFEVPSMRLLETLPGSRGPIPNIAISPDGMTLAIPTWGGFVQLWSRRVNAEVGRLPVPVDSIACARFSPDGNELVVSTWGKGVFVFEALDLQNPLSTDPQPSSPD